MSPKPLVSVIIIFLNAEQFLQEAVESILTQTYDHWELLLVDDGSTDGSTALARRYAEKQPDQVRYLEHEAHQNRGMSAARNLGISHACGEHIFFLDSDDVVRPNTLEAQVDILETQPEAALVFGPLQWWYSWAGKPEESRRDFVENLGVPPNTLIRPPRLLALFLRDKATVPSGFLVRREAVKRAGGFEAAFRGEYEDQVFCVKICLKEAVFAAGECWYHYRQHPNSCVSLGHQTGQTYSARLAFLNWLESYLSDQQVKPREVWQALQLELLPYRHPLLYRVLRQGSYFTMQIKERLRWGYKVMWNLYQTYRVRGYGEMG